MSNEPLKTQPPGKAYIFALGFAVTMIVWSLCWVFRLPGLKQLHEEGIAKFLLAGSILLGPVVGGFFAGRFSGAGLRSGFYVGGICSILNLLILGSALKDAGVNSKLPSPSIWLPGSVLLGIILGGIGSFIGSRIPYSGKPKNWTGLFTVSAAAGTFFLIILGGVVTGSESGLAVPDWPNSYEYNMFLFPLSRMTGGVFYEHAHRLYGSLIGLTTLVLAVFLFFSNVPKYLKWIGLIAFVLVCIQGILGGLRVTGNLTLSAEGKDLDPNHALGVIHGVLGQIFFSILAAMAVITSEVWKKDETPKPFLAYDTDRTLFLLLPIILTVQLILGAMLRHFGMGLHLHITVGVVLAVFGVACGVRGWGLYKGLQSLNKVGLFLAALFGIQILFGFGSVVVTGGFSPTEADRAAAPTTANIIVTTIHQGIGALLLALSVVLLLLHRKLTESAPDEELESSSEAEAPMI